MQTRREFIGGAAAVFSLAGCQSTGRFAARPDLKFGVISDTHVTTPESTARLREALRYFRRRGADAVMIAGDLTDWGLKSGYDYLAEAWKDEMAGTGIELLMCTGNHDYDGWWYGDMTLDMHMQGYSEDDALCDLGMGECWEKSFGEQFGEIRRRTIKGYHFISAEFNWKNKTCGDEMIAKWLSDHADELKTPGRPFFFFRHIPIPGVAAGASKDDKPNPLKTTLDGFANCFAFTGHTHRTLNDESSIWQDAFTAISVPSLSYTSVPRGYDNGSDSRKGDSTLGMRRIPSRENLEQPQGFFVSVYPNRVEIERHDFGERTDIADPWIVPEGKKPYTFEAQRNRVPVPQFPSGATVRTFVSNGDTRNGRWTIFMTLEFPAAKATKGRAFDYEVRAEMTDGTVAAVKRFLSPTFHRAHWRDADVLRFDFDGMSLPDNGDYRLKVYPRNSLGVAGRPIASCLFSPKPGKEKVQKKRG